MSRSTVKYLNRIKRRKRVRRKVFPIVFLLCLLMSCSVFWWLRSEGIALEEEQVTVVADAEPDGEENEVSITQFPVDLIAAESEEAFEGANVSEKSEASVNENDMDDQDEADTSEAADQEPENGDVVMTQAESDLNHAEADQNAIVTENDEPDDIDAVTRFEALSPAGIRVSASAKPGTFQDKVTLSVKDIEASEAKSAARDGTEAEAIAEGGKVKPVLNAVAVDISFLNEEGEEVEPTESGTVEVAIELPGEMTMPEGEIRLFHQMEDGSVEAVEDAIVAEDGASFEAESFSIYVITALGDAEMNHIHEYLAGYDFFPGAPIADGYYANSKNAPYVMNIGDSFEIYSPDGDTSKYEFWCEHTGAVLVRPADHSYNFDVQHGSEKYIHAIYGANSAGTAIIHLKNKTTNQDVDLFYVEVRPWGSELDHADIEVTDGGQYVEKRIAVDEKGNSVTTELIYDSVVTGVNDCWIYSKYGGGVLVHYESSDYAAFGEYGTTQYELTSKWDNNKNKFWDDQVAAARFDIVLSYFLRKKTVTVVKAVEGGGSIVTVNEIPVNDIPSEDPVEREKVSNHVAIDMDRQSVLDAYNKCPNHSGLDFTIRSNESKDVMIDPVKIKLKGKKTISGGELPADPAKWFKFELRDEASNIVETVMHDASGQIEFRELTFLMPGTYNYTIREVLDGASGAYLYDTKVVDVSIVVTEDKDGVLTATIRQPDGDGSFEFINTALYQLPNTGGIGTNWFTMGGVALISLSGLSLYRRRKRSGG